MIMCLRSDNIYRGPMNSSITNLMTGLICVRAYEKLDVFRTKFVESLDRSCNTTFTMYSVMRLMCLYLDFACLAFTGCVALFTLIVNVDPKRNAEMAFSL
jgi:hypothetical protein